MSATQESIARAADAIQAAGAVLIGAGAGMGVDSGLPDFRGPEGFWRAYPPLGKLGIRFEEMANPHWFERDPELAWGFYGHRLRLYRDTRPHGGFEVLKRWGDSKRGGSFVFTSNVDGQFQAAGFTENVAECHGSLHHLQCSQRCHGAIWDAADIDVEVDHETFRATPPLPACPRCGAVSRPNVLMFGDWGWIAGRTVRQEDAFGEWLSGNRSSDMVVVECGAGTSVPTVRWRCEQIAAGRGTTTLIRINPREAHGPPGTVTLALPALEAMQAIDERIPSLEPNSR